MYFPTVLSEIVARVIEEQQSYVAHALSLENLNSNYQNDKGFVEAECIMKHYDEERWVSCLLYQVPESDRTIGMLVITDIDDRKRKEIALKERAERDGLTGLYNAATTRVKIAAMNLPLCYVMRARIASLIIL